jgi:hypothetical protein
MATHCERAAGLRCAGIVLQSAWPHVLLVFNGSSAAHLAGAHRRPCLIAPWKIHAPPDGDHDGQVAIKYLFTLMARNPLSPHETRGASRGAHSQETRAGATGHVVAPELPWAWWRKLEPRGTCRLWSCHEPEGRSWGHGHVARGVSGALLSQEVKARATGHVNTHERPSHLSS